MKLQNELEQHLGDTTLDLPEKEYNGEKYCYIITSNSAIKKSALLIICIINNKHL